MWWDLTQYAYEWWSLEKNIQLHGCNLIHYLPWHACINNCAIRGSYSTDIQLLARNILSPAYYRVPPPSPSLTKHTILHLRPCRYFQRVLVLKKFSFPISFSFFLFSHSSILPIVLNVPNVCACHDTSTVPVKFILVVTLLPRLRCGMHACGICSPTFQFQFHFLLILLVRLPFWGFGGREGLGSS